MARGGDGRRVAGACALRPSPPSPAPSTVAVPPIAGDLDPDAMPERAAYFQVKDPDEKVARRVGEVRRSGEFPRGHPELGEEDRNTEAAITLCQ